MAKFDEISKKNASKENFKEKKPNKTKKTNWQNIIQFAYDRFPPRVPQIIAVILISSGVFFILANLGIIRTNRIGYLLIFFLVGLGLFLIIDPKIKKS